MFQGRPRTSTCSHNFLGVRFGVSEIALSAYPTLKIRCKLRGPLISCRVHGACYSNPGLGFELVRLRAPRFSRQLASMSIAAFPASQKCYLCARNDLQLMCPKTQCDVPQTSVPRSMSHIYGRSSTAWISRASRSVKAHMRRFESG
jgi:hypothetical protein